MHNAVSFNPLTASSSWSSATMAIAKPEHHNIESGDHAHACPPSRPP